MKKNIVLVLSILVLTSCGGNTKEEQEYKEAQESFDAEMNKLIEIQEANKIDQVEDNTKNESTNKSSNTNWDQVLDDYESMIDDYDKFVSKMQSGNVDSQNVMSMATKTHKMQEKLDRNKSELSAAQIQRLNKIAMRLTQIASKAATINTENIKSINGVNLEDLGL